MLLGIQLTPGHLIIAAILLVGYDAWWTWVMHDHVSAWWFERLQGYLKTGIYAAFLAFVALVLFTPEPWNWIILLATVVSVVFISLWLKRRTPIVRGTLQIVVTGLAAGASPNIIATGPVNKTSHGSATWSVPIGRYAITASAVGPQNPTVTGSPANVAAGATVTVTVSYA